MSTSVRPTEGNHPSFTEKMYLRMIARKKIGIEIPIRDATRLVWSIHVPYCFAAMKPKGMPKTIAKSIAPTASSTVAGNRSPELLRDRAARRDARAEVAVDELCWK